MSYPDPPIEKVQPGGHGSGNIFKEELIGIIGFLRDPGGPRSTKVAGYLALTELFRAFAGQTEDAVARKEIMGLAHKTYGFAKTLGSTMTD